jgi:predicted small lipoprotein YifL
VTNEKDKAMAARTAIRMICLWGVVLLTLAGCGPKLPEGCPPDCAGANLRGANLSEADLREADLQQADLSGADLSGANLSTAYLAGADLTGADLSGAEVTDEQLAQAKSLEGVTMPDGTKHE